jgi:hypothetical protein
LPTAAGIKASRGMNELQSYYRHVYQTENYKHTQQWY